MNSQDLVLDMMRAQGKSDALDLRKRAYEMDGTSIIAEEVRIPNFDPNKDYIEWPVGAPVVDGGQVWTLLQPYNSAYYEGKPAELRALWGLCHTKDPAKAKLYVAPYGTSGLYMQDECYIDDEGTVWISVVDNNAYSAAEYPQNWRQWEE